MMKIEFVDRDILSGANFDLTRVHTLINVDAFENLLKLSRYDPGETEFLVEGLKNGFSLEYEGPHEVRRNSPNLRFMIGDKIDLWNKVIEEVNNKRYAGPFESVPYENYIQSPIGLVPKDNGKKMRLIFHLSYPKNTKFSVNANTPYEKCRVVYKDIDHAIRRCIQELEQGGCYLAKSDLKSAFRILGIRPEDWPLLVMKAENPRDGKIYYFVDKCLPFGHAISCSLFQKVSDALTWIVKWKSGKENTNYLDDFFFTDCIRYACNRQVEIFLELCRTINFPYAADKTYKACTKLVFLGLLIDADLGLICIAIEKKRTCVRQKLLKKKKKKLIEIQKLAGYLNFLCKAIVPGRAFVRRLYYLCKGLEKPHHHTYLKKGVRQDLAMWHEFLQHPSIYCRPFSDFDIAIKATEVNFYTDASRNFNLGAGGICYNAWFSLKWDPSFMEKAQPSIEYLELYAVLIGVLNWLHLFANRRITIFCDNISVVYMINRNTTTCKHCLKLIRMLVLHSMICNVRVTANYVSSKNNRLADLLSRNKITEFKKLSGSSDSNPTPIPENLWPMERVWEFE